MYNSLAFSMSSYSTLTVILVSLAGGLSLGYAIRAFLAKWQADSIEKQAKLKLDAAEIEADRRLREADIAARSEIVRAKELFEQSLRSRHAALQERDERLSAREENLEKKLKNLEERENALETAAREQKERGASLASFSERLDERERALAIETERVAGMTADEAKRRLVSSVKEDAMAECGAYFRKKCEETKLAAEARSAEIVADAVRRYSRGHGSDAMTSLVPVPNAEMKARVVGRDGRNARAIEAETGASLLLDATPDAIVVSSFNPLRREVARLALCELVADGRIHPASIEVAIARARESLDGTLLLKGREAVESLGLEGVSSEIARTLGSLAFRLSFSQNALEHSIEVAHLMGSMASELKLDSRFAARIGLFHDIGKGLGDIYASHAVAGAKMLRDNGEDALLANAVASHHDEEPPESVYAVLCAAADAISSARPGARNESGKLYCERIAKLEEIAMAHRGVKSAMAMQAGHELRVIVDPDVASDAEAMNLARDVSARIEGTMRYPGQIKVIVVRERRCVEYAR